MQLKAIIRFSAGIVCLVGQCAFAAVPDQRAFSSPQNAAQELVQVLARNDIAELSNIFGPNSQDLVSSGDPVADRSARRAFAALAAEHSRVEISPHGTATLLFGEREWPFPIPLTQSARGWQFNTADGKEEIINRRIGQNEIETIRTLRAFVQAQEEYLERRPNGVAEYAQRIGSTPNTRDGLFWPRRHGEPVSPLGPLAVEAQDDGYKTREEAARSFHGYRYRVLTSQGPHAPGGPMNYKVGEHMSKGFAFVAYPVEWGTSGVMSFIVGKDGHIFERNLGPESNKVAEAIATFNPSNEWKRVDLAALALHHEGKGPT